MATTLQTVERTSESPHLKAGERLRELAAHREILLNLTRKELKVKYAASVLGAVWSLLSPLVYLSSAPASRTIPCICSRACSPGTCSARR
jgi:hypothetical protein